MKPFLALSIKLSNFLFISGEKLISIICTQRKEKMICIKLKLIAIVGCGP